MGLMAMVQRQIPTALVLVSRFLLYGVSAGEDTDSAVTAPWPRGWNLASSPNIGRLGQGGEGIASISLYSGNQRNM